MRTVGVGLIGRWLTRFPAGFQAFFFDRIVFVDLRREFNIELKREQTAKEIRMRSQFEIGTFMILVTYVFEDLGLVEE